MPKVCYERFSANETNAGVWGMSSNVTWSEEILDDHTLVVQLYEGPFLGTLFLECDQNQTTAKFEKVNKATPWPVSLIIN